MVHKRALAAAVATVIALSGCGNADEPVDSGSTTTSSVLPSTTTTGASPEPTVGPAPSVLDLIDDLGTHGRFSVTVPSGIPSPTTRTYTGRYLRTSAGTTTVVDLDLELVQAEVDRLLAMEDRFDSLDPLFAEAVLSPATVVTDHLQLPLADVLLQFGRLGYAGALSLEPSLAFTAVERGDLEACQRDLRALRSRVRDRIAASADQLGSGWRPDATALGGDELIAVRRSCDGLDDVADDTWELVVEARSVRIEAGGETGLTIEVEPGAGEAVAVDEDAPTAPLLDRFGVYLLAIDRCGGLPWLYSDFMAGNSYTSPDEAAYIGPTPFEAGAACADELPEGSSPG